MLVPILSSLPSVFVLKNPSLSPPPLLWSRPSAPPTPNPPESAVLLLAPPGGVVLAGWLVGQSTAFISPPWSSRLEARLLSFPLGMSSSHA